MLQSALDHYAREQRITGLGLVAARARRFDTLDSLTATMSRAMALAAIEAARGFRVMLDEQEIDAPSQGTPQVAPLLSRASDGRSLRGLLDYTRDPAVTDWEFKRIVATQLQDVARSSAAIQLGARPDVEGYVRMLNPPSCSRCAVLAGRFYRRSTGFKRHPNCDCRHVPTTENTAGDLRTDPNLYFASLTREAQDKIFTNAGAEAIRRGADVNRVVNARRGMSTAQVNARGWAPRGRLARTDVFGQPVYTTTEATKGLAVRTRLMPESILEIATSEADTLRLLRIHGYLQG